MKINVQWQPVVLAVILILQLKMQSFEGLLNTASQPEQSRLARWPRTGRDGQAGNRSYWPCPDSNWVRFSSDHFVFGHTRSIPRCSTFSGDSTSHRNSKTTMVGVVRYPCVHINVPKATSQRTHEYLLTTVNTITTTLPIPISVDRSLPSMALWNSLRLQPLLWQFPSSVPSACGQPLLELEINILWIKRPRAASSSNANGLSLIRVTCFGRPWDWRALHVQYSSWNSSLIVMNCRRTIFTLLSTT